MFKGNGSTNNGKSIDPNSPESLNRIVQGTKIKGDIDTESNIRIDGILVGTIKTKGRLVVGKTGIIEGDIVCQNADIEGKIKGKIVVNQLLSLKATSDLQGEILTGQIAIEPGANFSGNCNMGSHKKVELPKEEVAEPAKA